MRAAIEPIDSRSVSVPHNFWIGAISPRPPPKPIAPPSPPSDLFSRVCHGDSITRSRDISTVRSFLPRVPPEGTSPALYFFFLRAPSVAHGAGVVAPTIFAISRRAIFPARGLFAPSAGPLSYFPPGNIAPTRKTILGRGPRDAGRTKGRPSDRGRSGKCFRVITFVSASAFPP